VSALVIPDFGKRERLAVDQLPDRELMQSYNNVAQLRQFRGQGSRGIAQGNKLLAHLLPVPAENARMTGNQPPLR